MLPQYKRTTNLGVGIGFLLQIAGRVLTKQGMEFIGLLIWLIGLAAFIWGCGQYAKAKGYSPWFGGLGLLSFVGLIVLVLFRDKHKTA
jgi:hypothetical protein